VPADGLEPTISRLQVGCITSYASPAIFLLYS
jgi:hypothetical protein